VTAGQRSTVPISIRDSLGGHAMRPPVAASPPARCASTEMSTHASAREDHAAGRHASGRDRMDDEGEADFRSRWADPVGARRCGSDRTRRRLAFSQGCSRSRPPRGRAGGAPHRRRLGARRCHTRETSRCCERLGTVSTPARSVAGPPGTVAGRGVASSRTVQCRTVLAARSTGGIRHDSALAVPHEQAAISFAGLLESMGADVATTTMVSSGAGGRPARAGR